MKKWEELINREIVLVNGIGGTRWVRLGSTTLVSLWGDHTAEYCRDVVVDLIKNWILFALDEELYVVPHTDPPLTQNMVEQIRYDVKKYPMANQAPNVEFLLELVDWQKSVIAFMTKDNGYQEGYKKGNSDGYDEGYNDAKKQYETWGALDL